MDEDVTKACDIPPTDVLLLGFQILWKRFDRFPDDLEPPDHGILRADIAKELLLVEPPRVRLDLLE